MSTDNDGRRHHVKGDVVFTLKFAITSLCLAKRRKDVESLFSPESDQGETLKLRISLDRDVIAMENLQTDAEGRMKSCCGASMSVRASSSAEFADKLATHPITLHLSHPNNIEIGSQTLRPSDCFVKSTTSESFSSETLCKRVNIVGKDGGVNAKLSLILLIEKTSREAAAAAAEALDDVKLKTTSNKVNASVTTAGKKMRQRRSRKIGKVLQQSSSNSSSSSEMAISIPQKSIKRRVCSKCFDDLSVLPGNNSDDVKCPKCAHQRRTLEEIAHSKRFDDARGALENVNIQKCIKSALEELMYAGGDRQRVHLMKKESSMQRVGVNCSGTSQQTSRKSNFTAMKKKVGKRAAYKRWSGSIRQTTAEKTEKNMECKLIQHPPTSCETSPFSLVPRTKGWRWNTNDGSRQGWRPGAVSKSVARIMKFFAAQRRLEQDEARHQPEVGGESPTLQISGRNGEFCIILNSNSTSSVDPIVFMLTKSNFARRIARAKEALLRAKGLLKAPCNCDELHFANCKCIERGEREKIEFELAELSKEENGGDDLRLSDELTFQLLLKSSKVEDDTEVDFTFTPARFADECKSAAVSYAASQVEWQDMALIKAAGSQLKLDDDVDNGVKRPPVDVAVRIPAQQQRKKGSKDDSGKMTKSLANRQKHVDKAENRAETRTRL